MSQMAKDVELRIRALPGNTVCCDCDNINPQWASVSYGTLMCLECSGHHRSLGVHLSFVRSIAMDSWTEKQINAMEKSGGNSSLVDYFKSRGIEKNVRIPTKYNTKQAEYLRNRLVRWMEGRREPPPDPGRWDPTTGVSEAQGAEALPGETTEQYNERQGKLRDAARERMRAKFGDGGLNGIGASGSVSYDGSGGGGGGDGLSDKLGGAVSGIGSFLKDKVIDNERLRGTVGGVAGGVAGGYNSLRQSERFGGAVGKVGGVFGSIASKIAGPEKPTCDMSDGMTLAQKEKALWDSMYAPREPVNNEITRVASAPVVAEPDSSPFKSSGNIVRAKTTSSVNMKVSSADFDDFGDDWGDFDAKPRAQTMIETKSEVVVEVRPKSLSVSAPTPAPATPAPAVNSGYSAKPAGGSPDAKAQPMKVEKPPVMETAPVPEKAKSPTKLQSADDFFADFGM